MRILAYPFRRTMCVGLASILWNIPVLPPIHQGCFLTDPDPCYPCILPLLAIRPDVCKEARGYEEFVVRADGGLAVPDNLREAQAADIFPRLFL